MKEPGQLRVSMASLLQSFTTFFIFLMTMKSSLADENETKKIILNLKYSGPGVMDSNLTFDAHLCYANGSVVGKNLYVYEWKDDASKFDRSKKTVNHTKSQIEKVYYSDSIVFKYKPGRYSMNVTVYKSAGKGENNRGPKVADESMEFILTENLNGFLYLHQNTSVKRNSTVFATGVPIYLTANITDNINLVKTTYSWHVNNSSTEAITTKPHFKKQFEKPGWHYLGVTAKGSYVKNPVTRQVENKTGLLKDYIWLADRVTNITYSGNLTFSTGDLLAANISCDGSPPFYVCTNISIEVSEPHHCTDFRKENDCATKLSENLTLPGNYIVVVVVKNDVSLQSLSVKLSVKDPDLPLGGSAVVTVACIVIALFVITLVLFSYRKQNKNAKRMMETANFDFHRFQSGSSQTSSLSIERIKRLLSSLFSSRSSSIGSDRSSNEPPVRYYGAVNS